MEGNVALINRWRMAVQRLGKRIKASVPLSDNCNEEVLKVTGER